MLPKEYKQNPFAQLDTYYIRLTAFFQDNLDKTAPER